MSSTLVGAERAMTAKKKSPERPKRDDKAVKMERTLVDKAIWVATRKGTTAAEYLSDLVRGQVERDFAREVKDVERDH